jgi:hypothetical protein
MPATYSKPALCWGAILTNLFKVNQGYDVRLYTGCSISGQYMANVWGAGLNGKVTWSSNCNYYPQNWSSAGYSYSSDGWTNISNGLSYGGLTKTWYPGTNDISLSFTNDSGQYITLFNTNNLKVTFPTFSSYRNAVCTGAPNTFVTAQVGGDYFAGSLSKYVYPFTNNFVYANTTNNISPAAAIPLHAPTNGKYKAVFLLIGNNDAAAGVQRFAGENVHQIQTNKVSFMSYVKSFPGYQVYLITTPQVPNTYATPSVSNNFVVMHADELTTPASVCDGIIDLYGILQASGADRVSTNYIDGTHGTVTFTTYWGNLFYTNRDFNSIPPVAGYVPMGALPPPNYAGFWNSNFTGNLFFVTPGVSTNHVVGP